MTSVAIPDRELWEKRPRESFKAFAAFAVYRDLGPERTLPKTTAALSGKPGLEMIQKWSAANDWIERAEAYDLYIDRRLREQREGDIVQAERNERAIGLSLQRVAAQRIQGRGVLGEEGFIAALSPGELTPQDVARFATEGIRIRRLSDGQATDLLKGSIMVAPAELERVVRAVIEQALPLIPEELHERFISGVLAIPGTRA